MIILFGNDAVTSDSLVLLIEMPKGAPRDFTVATLVRIGRAQLRPMRRRKGQLGGHIRFCLLSQGSEFARLWPQLVGDFAPVAASASSGEKALSIKAETTLRVRSSRRGREHYASRGRGAASSPFLSEPTPRAADRGST